MRSQATAQLLLVIVLCALWQKSGAASESITGLRWTKITPANDPPSGREDHAIGYDRIRNTIIVFGGKGPLADSYIYNITSNTWRAVPNSVCAARFSMVYGVDQTGGRDRFIVCLGQAGAGVFYNDCCQLDLATEVWSKVVTSGTPPLARYGQAGGVFPLKQDFLLASHGFATTRFDDAAALRLADNTWLDMTADSKPTRRCLVGSTVIENNAMVMFGGCGSKGFGPCPARDAWLLETQATTSTQPEKAATRWTQYSYCPPPRISPVMVISPGTAINTSSVQQVIAFGGRGGVYGNGGAGEVALLDVKRNEWLLVTPEGTDLPSPRTNAGLVYVSTDSTAFREADYVLMFGGGNNNDMWKLEAEAGITPKVRSCPFFFDLRLFHALLMFFSWGLFLPLGGLIARYYKHVPGQWWFKVHRPLQMFGLLLAIGGFIAAFLMVTIGHLSAPVHGALGVVIMALGLSQPINAFFRPHAPPKGEQPTRNRLLWEYLHRGTAYSALFLGMINPFWGFKYINAHAGYVGAYAAWFSLVMLFIIVKTIQGEPKTSPFAVAINKMLYGAKTATPASDTEMKP